MRSKVIHPITTTDFRPDVVEAFQKTARPGHTVSCEFVPAGPPTVECYFDEAFAVPGIIALAVEAEEAGYDAVIINCAADPGLDAVRERISIPVVGASQSAMHIACMIAHTFSVVALQSETKHMFAHLARRYGLHGRLASVRALGIGVLDLQGAEEPIAQGFAAEIEGAVREDGAQAVTLGCTGLVGVLRRARQLLEERGILVSVVDPVTAAVKMAETMCDLGLAQNPLAYPRPAARSIKGYPFYRS